jgi:hypothetical protein
MEAESMPRILVATISLLFAGVFPAVGRAQHQDVPLAIEELHCNFCHTCDKPTKRLPCLRGCPRTSAAAIAREMSQKRIPDEAILDELEELYLPVRFDHKGHAHMADMVEGCAVCHHYTPEGTARPACKTCHEVAANREDLRKPSLKAAYHRQCMGCHRAWSGETECAACHPPKAGEGQKIPTRQELLDKMSDPIKMPREKIYEPQAKPKVGARIIFRHKEHVDRFGITCAECHREDSCSRCHQLTEEKQPRASTSQGCHGPCAACHDVDNRDACDHCHWKKGERKPQPFDHDNTAWPLSKYHAELACRTCHEAVPFRKLDRNCNTCHSRWEPATFDHAVTGQVLDKNHEEIDCADCHAGRQFDSPPKCNECHDEDDGIAFPAKRPGPVVVPTRRENGRSSGG